MAAFVDEISLELATGFTALRHNWPRDTGPVLFECIESGTLFDDDWDEAADDVARNDRRNDGGCPSLSLVLIVDAAADENGGL